MGIKIENVKRVTVKALVYSRFLIDTDQPNYDYILKHNIELMKDQIWNKIQTLTREDMNNLIIEIEDWM